MRSSARLLCEAPAGHILTSSPRSVARNHDPIIGEQHARAREEQKLSKCMGLRRLLPARRRRQHGALHLPGCGISQCNSERNAVKSANRWAAFGQRARCNF